VEELKDKLYSRTLKEDAKDIRAPLSPGESGARALWEDSDGQTPQAQMRNRSGPFADKKASFSLAKKFFIASAGFFIVALGAAAYFFFGGANFISSRNIDLQIVAPSLIDGGSEAQLQFIVQNRNASELRLVDLVIEYPAGTRDPKDPTKEYPRERQSLGTIEPGRQLKRTASAVFYGQEGSVQKVRATLEYSVKGSTAIFTKESEASFTIGSSPVSVAIDAPSEVVSGAPFAIEMEVRSNAQSPTESVAIEVQYPAGFSLQNSSPRAGAGGLWRLGTLEPGASETIILRGILEGQDGDNKVFRFLAGQESDETSSRVRVPFLSMPVTLSVARPMVAGSISVDGQSGKTIAAQAGRKLQGFVSWRNNSAEAVQDIEVSLALKGPMLERGSIESTAGFFQSVDNSIIWTKTQDPSLARAEPGGGGSLQFSFATLPPGTSGTLYSNPTIDLSLSVRASRAPSGGEPQEITGAAQSQVVLASAVSLLVRASVSGGVAPPRAESATTYNIVWSIKNSSNTVGGTAVSAVLPPYVQFISGGEGITYDQSSRTVRWSVGDVKAGVGYTSAAREVSFQISMSPSQSQVGQAPQITGAAALTGTDRFAQVQVSATAEAPTTGAAVLPK